ncbi:MAG: RagB/SusD family nutrient uptake outer membrane protein [Cyclobacteriaceae bacterium]
MKYLIYNIQKVVFLVLFISVATSCEDLLKEEPLTQLDAGAFYQNEDDALAALTAAYAQLKSGNGYYRQLWLSNLIAASDIGSSSDNHGDFIRGNIVNTSRNLPTAWEDIYIAIRDANNVIANVPNIDVMNDTLRNRIVGEARFLRGLHYFNLVRTFGEVPLRTAPIEVGQTEGLPVSKITEVYQLILDDLDFAAANCWDKGETRGGYTNNVGRATNSAAHALLTKAYLRIASAKRTALEGVLGNQLYLDFPEDPSFYYQKAVDHADMVINSGNQSLIGTLDEWTGLFDADNGNNQEMIFEIQGSSLTEQGTALSNLFTPRNAGLSGGGFGGANKFVGAFILNQIDRADPRFLNSIITAYQDETIRYEINLNMNGYFRTDIRTGESRGILYRVFSSKYIDRSATTEYTSGQNWHVIRLADVYLMRAEALAELNNDPSAANVDFNILRQRVGMEDYDGALITGMDQFRSVLLRERAAELIMEGHRYFDITRLGVYDEYCTITIGATNGRRDPEDYLWPIPLTETSVNNAID